MASEAEIEALARKMCADSGYEPDLLVSQHPEPIIVKTPLGHLIVVSDIPTMPLFRAYRYLAVTALRHARDKAAGIA